MTEPEVVRQVRILAERGWGAKRIARALGLARNTVRRYLRGGPRAQVQTRPRRRRLDYKIISANRPGNRHRSQGGAGRSGLTPLLVTA
jgi:transposase